MTKAFKDNVLLFIFLAIFLLKGVVYGCYLMPLYLGTSPDDTGHVSYVVYMYTEHKLPIYNVTPMEHTVYQSYHDMKNNSVKDASYYQVNLNSYQSVPTEAGDDTGPDELVSRPNWIAQHPPFYYLYLMPFFGAASIFTSQLSYLIITMRMATLILGLIALTFVYLGLKRLGAGRLCISCVMATLTFSHAFQFYMTTIDNDSMVICLSAIAFYLFTSFMKTGANKFLYIFALTAGLITITKYTGAVVLPVYAGAYIYEKVRKKEAKPSKIIVPGLIVLGIFAVLTAPVIINNLLAYKVFFPLGAKPREFDGSIRDFIAVKKYPDILFRNILALTGWRNWVFADNHMMAGASLIFFVIYLIKNMHISKRSGSSDAAKYVFLGFAPMGIAIALRLIIGCTFPASLAVTSLIGIFAINLTASDMNKPEEDRRFVVLAELVVIIYAVVFAIQHYRFYLNQGELQAMHGRYYYILALPFLWLVYRGLDTYAARIRPARYVPVLIAVLCIISETALAWQGINHWGV